MNTRTVRVLPVPGDRARSDTPVSDVRRPGSSAPGGPVADIRVSDRSGRRRRALQGLALAAVVPYLTLKSAWLAGSHAGIPEGSPLRDPGWGITLANAMTVGMDAVVVLLVLVLTRPWGLRAPWWALVVPVFTATGLLAPITVGFPAELLMNLLGAGPGGGVAQPTAEPFLDSWVFAVVYTGFGLQALALAGLFVPYARQRWGAKWQGAPAPYRGRWPRVATALAVPVSLAVGAAQAYWACGGTAGLPGGRAQGGALPHVLYALFVLTAAAGGLLVVHGRRWGIRRARGPLAVSWVGASVSVCWAGWLGLAPLLLGARGEHGTPEMYMTYAGQVITGLLVAAVLAGCLATRRTA